MDGETKWIRKGDIQVFNEVTLPPDPKMHSGSWLHYFILVGISQKSDLAPGAHCFIPA